MRPLEAFTLIALALLAVVSSDWLLRSRRRIGFYPLVVAIVAALQILVDGWRWQMFPAYAVIVLLVWRAARMQTARNASGSLTPAVWFRVVVALLLVLAAALCIILPVFEFPEPTGPYTVGTSSTVWEDQSRLDPWRSPPAAAGPRRLRVQWWYPCEPGARAKPAPYFDGGKQTARALIASRAPFFPFFLLDHFDRIETRALQDAQILPSDDPYPVILFCHGYGGLRAQNTALVCELASHGYVVIALDFAYAAAITDLDDGTVAEFQRPLQGNFPGGGGTMTDEELLAIWSADARFVIDQLERANAGEIPSPLQGLLDLDRVGVVGHSFGGATAVDLCRIDPRLKAGINLDGFVTDLNNSLPVRAPFLAFMAGTFNMKPDELIAMGAPEPFARRAEAGRAAIRALINEAKADAYLLILQGSRHETFTDMPLYTPYAHWFGMGASLDGPRAVAIVNDYCLSFFDQYLKGTVSRLFDGPADGYPEVLWNTPDSPLP